MANNQIEQRRTTAGSGAARFVVALVLVTLVLLAGAVLPPGSAAEENVTAAFSYVAPRPGATLVSAGTTVAVRPAAGASAAMAQDLGFAISGSASGAHSGETILAADGQTIIFKPDAPFADGEQVQVVLQLGGKRYHYDFSISPALPAGSTATALEHLLVWPVSTRERLAAALEPQAGYRTAPADLPQLTTRGTTTGLAGGLLFLGYFNAVYLTRSTPYVVLVDDEGEVVYYKQTYGMDVRKQPDGTLTYFNPLPKHQRFYALNERYEIVNTYEAGNGYTTDLHDLQVQPDGRALLMIYDERPVDMSQLVAGGKPDAVVVGCVVQELDKNKNVIFEWRSWDHISIMDTNQPLTTRLIRYIHCNSLEYDSDGNILMSSRHLDEVTKIDRQTGNILWRMGGKANQFTFTNDDGFTYQHDARRLPNGHITLFDNRSTEAERFSRGVEYLVDEQAMTVTRVAEFRTDPDTFGLAMGNMQRLPNGNTLIGWGRQNDPVMTEFNAAGEELFSMSAPPGLASYRIVRHPWVGRPRWTPRLVAEPFPEDAGASSAGQTAQTYRLYVSWNGATEVGSYEIFAGRDLYRLPRVATVPRDGFETSHDHTLEGEGLWIFRVRVMDKKGEQMAWSNWVTVSVGQDPYYVPLIVKGR